MSGAAKVIPQSEHGIGAQTFSGPALKSLEILTQAGFDAYIVGGGIRDPLLGQAPKDFDVATNATPEQIKDLFRRCRLIGRRFRLAHVYFGRDIIEVATFRASDDAGERDVSDEGRIVADNIYGTIEEDALRRDFALNALYYDARDETVLDFVDGYPDARAGVLRIIGDAEARYREDPVRLLRAVRIAAKLGLDIEPGTEAPLRQLGDLLDGVAPARLFDESLKLFLSGHAAASLEGLIKYDLFEHLFPRTAEWVEQDDELHGYRLLLERGMANTDQRIAEGKPVTPAFLYAVLLWPPVWERAQALIASDNTPAEALEIACEEVISEQVQRIAVPRRFSAPMREIWQFQSRLMKTRGRAPQRLVGHARFRAAYDFLLLRAEQDDLLVPLAEFWTEAQEPGKKPATGAAGGGDSPGHKKKRGRRKRGRSRGGRRRRAPKAADGNR